LFDISAGVRSTRSEDGAIVLDIDHGQMFRLNPVGALILESLGKGCAETEIAQEIARQYSISEERASADIREFLQSLAAYKLVRVRRGEGIS
jgi:Coenzyme PQQ synthesis protein D (PqqD)